MHIPSPTSTLTDHFVVLFLWLSGWLCHILCVILRNHIMDLHMSSLSIIVPEGPGCVFYATRRQVYWNLESLAHCGFLLVFWFDITQTKTHRTPRVYLYNIYKYHLLCAHSSCLYYIEWIVCWYQRFVLRNSTMSLLFKNYSLVEVINLLIRFDITKFFPWNRKKTNRNGTNKHTHALQNLR